MIDETGNNLFVVITTEPDKNWETFATWYSIYKNWPNAKPLIVCNRNGEMPFKYFQWARRLKIPLIHRTPYKEESELFMQLDCVRLMTESGEINGPVLIIKPLMMAVDTFDPKFLNFLNNESDWRNNNVCYLRDNKIKNLIDDYYLSDWMPKNLNECMCFEAKESNNFHPIISYKKGCGRWIDTSKGCPFSSAGGLISDDMTLNENRVIELWKKMVSLYNSVV